MKRTLRLTLLALLLAAGGVWAQSPAADPSTLQAERARIAAERSRINARFAIEEKACHQRFAVNDCLKASRERQREELDVLRQQEIVLNDAERQRKGAEQLQKLEEKQRARELDQASRPGALPLPEPKTPPTPHGGKLPRTAEPRTPDTAKIEAYQQSMRRKQEQHAADEARRAAQAANAPAEEQRNAARQREAAEYKARTLERNARKPSTAQPLPVPAP